MTRVPPSSPFPGGSGPGVRPAAGSQLATPIPSGFIGRYQVLEKIGEGGMGALFLARDPAIDRLVAIKLLRRGFDTEALRERFAREARAVGRLKHPNIVTIFDVGEHDGDPFFAMEFLAGETLGELIRHNAGLSLSRRLKLLEELCDGLAYAHRAGLVHRDVKPANLMVDAEGVLKILDFGIVRIEESGMTQAGVLVGTINYMSPEQVLGTGVDHRSDIFAVGLVAYELLSGKQAFMGSMKDGLLRRIPNVEIEPLASVRPGLDADVIAIVDKALQKNPEDRYQELAKMRNDLTRARQRIEVEEERAAVEAASAAAETAFIAEEPTAPGIAPVPLPQNHPGHALIADAERALAEGNYRFALTMAGRVAALDPQARTPSTIVARAEAGLLERGRSSGGSQPGTAPAPGSTPLSGAAVQAASSPSAIAQSQRATYLAFAVALVALMVAGFAVWSQVRPSETGVGTEGRIEDPASSPRPSSTTSNPQPPPANVSQPQASPSVEVPQTQTSPSQPADPDRAALAKPDPAPQQPERSNAQQQNASAVTRQPARGEQPRQQDNTGRGRAASDPAPKVGREQAQTGQGRETGAGQPPGTGGSATSPVVTRIPLGEPAAPPAILPGASAPRPSIPTPPPVKPVEKAPENKPEAPRRDPRAEAEAGVRRALQRYEAAWEALDADALGRVQVLSGSDARVIRQRMDGYRVYEMDMTVQNVTVAGDARSATVACQIAYRFQGPTGGRQTSNQRLTFSVEKRGENWMITSIR
ncbi:MAG TPA: protein kinase [Vicinamibacterales bacterium]|nr:protein kinase [Vicinamibacterales bacterium]